MSRHRLLAAGCLGVLLIFGCSADSVSRSEWQAMTQSERELYVRSLIGGEQARDAKGGSGRPADQPPSAYVDAIDAAYARGDQRDAGEIFQETLR